MRVGNILGGMPRRGILVAVEGVMGEAVGGNLGPGSIVSNGLVKSQTSVLSRSRSLTPGRHSRRLVQRRCYGTVGLPVGIGVKVAVGIDQDASGQGDVANRAG